jgi:hypothetical protein
MELHGDVGHVESRFDLFRDNISVGVRQLHGLHQIYHRIINPFGHTRCTLGSRGCSGCSLRSVWRVLILMQHRSTDCAERTISPEIILDAPNGTPR